MCGGEEQMIVEQEEMVGSCIDLDYRDMDLKYKGEDTEHLASLGCVVILVMTLVASSQGMDNYMGLYLQETLDIH